MKNFTAILATICFSANLTYAQDFNEKLRSCIEELNHQCIFNLHIDRFENTDVEPIGGDGRWVTIAGAQLVNSLEVVLSNVEANQGRAYVERTLSMVESKHGETPFLRADLYLFLFEECKAAGDEECTINAKRYLCENMTKLEAPSSYNAEKKSEVLNRMINAIAGCEGI